MIDIWRVNGRGGFEINIGQRQYWIKDKSVLGGVLLFFYLDTPLNRFFK